jgi:hypothetical protein
MMDSSPSCVFDASSFSFTLRLGIEDDQSHKKEWGLERVLVVVVVVVVKEERYLALIEGEV